jgi:adenylate kinase family enzyme
VPNEITCQLLLDAMTTSPRKKFLVDGYPRNADSECGSQCLAADRTVNMGAMVAAAR